MNWKSYLYKPQEKGVYWVLRRRSNREVFGEVAYWYGTCWSEKSGQILFWRPVDDLPPGLQIVSRMAREHLKERAAS